MTTLVKHLHLPILFVASVTVGCTAPSFFQYKNAGYFGSGSLAAQLGNLGTFDTERSQFFERQAFFSDCGVNKIPVIVQGLIPSLVHASGFFQYTPKKKSLARSLGVAVTELENLSLLVLAINEHQLHHEILPLLQRNCLAKMYNLSKTKVVSGVVILLNEPLLQSLSSANQLDAILNTNGELTLTVVGKKNVSFVVEPRQVVAYRLAGLCWSDETGKWMTLSAHTPDRFTCPTNFINYPPDGWTWEAFLDGSLPASFAELEAQLLEEKKKKLKAKKAKAEVKAAAAKKKEKAEKEKEKEEYEEEEYEEEEYEEEGAPS
ncbi:MAG: hypothetical protein VYA34_02310 [Myxococcota bacterium]|nr:hypothetical protein [Myxococcota bacterium]